MAYIPRSSLIPNEASGAIPVQMKKRRTIHAFGLIATIIFVLSLLGAIGIFVYKDYLGKQLESAKRDLSSVSSGDSERKIEELQLYDDKLRIARNLLDNHIAPSLIFREIEDSTKETVQFSSLEYTYDPGFEAVLTLEGDTEAFTSVALQKMQILEDELFSDFVLQNITTREGSESEDGTPTESGVTFRVTGVFDRDFLRYAGQGEEEPDTFVPQEATVPEADPIEGEIPAEEAPGIEPTVIPPLP